jgi:hypothetical protein
MAYDSRRDSWGQLVEGTVEVQLNQILESYPRRGRMLRGPRVDLRLFILQRPLAVSLTMK